MANGVTVKNMTVNYGYTLKTSDYPAVPVVGGKTGEWIRYTRPITRNITITARYSDAGINPPVKPPIETSSIDSATISGNSAVKETVTAHHSYIYTGGQLAQETVTTTITPADGMSAPKGDVMFSAASGTTTSASSNIGNTATASGSATTTETLYYAYDANGIPMSLTYTNAQGTTTTYYYATNIQGDVTAILDSTGTAVVEYTYDAWGNPLAITGTLADTLGNLNSIRYRAYVYDNETGLYYLQSRYYSPKTTRFINADDYTSTGQGLLGADMFVYCLNNPANCLDEAGTMCVAMDSFLGNIIQTPARQTAGLLNGQGKLPYADESFGLGIYGSSGCAVIATYNAMQLIGRPHSLEHVANEFLFGFGTIALGAGGVAPHQIGQYFALHAVPVIGSYYMPALTLLMREDTIIVFTVMNDTEDIFAGFHTMTAQYKGGKYVVYNVSNLKTEPAHYQSLDEAYPEGAWIYGYRIIFS